MYAELVGNWGEFLHPETYRSARPRERGCQAMVWRISFPLTMKMTISATLVA